MVYYKLFGMMYKVLSPMIWVLNSATREGFYDVPSTIALTQNSVRQSFFPKAGQFHGLLQVVWYDVCCTIIASKLEVRICTMCAPTPLTN